MSNSVNKHIESLNNPEYKFLISLKKIEIENLKINLLLKDTEKTQI